MIGHWLQQLSQQLTRWVKGVGFHGGVHPAQHKLISTHHPIQSPPLAERLILPLNMHIGAPSEPVVSVGQQVLGGQIIARCAKQWGVPLHAPTSGIISDIGEHAIAHASGLKTPCIVITPDGENRMQDFTPPPAPQDPASLKAILLQAGIIGMGGAGFPSFKKISDQQGQIQTLIVNGAECEPFITCDDLLMRERSLDIIQGAQIMAQALGASRILLGIEDNKPEAIASMQRAAAGTPVEVCVVPTIYPMGGADQLITQLTGLEVPAEGHSTDLGLVMFNVATLAALTQAVTLGKPVLSRIVTLTGFALERPCNVEVPIGTPFEHLVRWAGLKQEDSQWIQGGPMMGVPVPDPGVPVVKTTNCILVNPPEPETETLPCIRCGACMDACPINLLPQQLYWYIKSGELDRLPALHLKDCIECGCCAYACPSHIPLVQYYRHGKVALRQAQADKEATTRAKARHDAKLARQQAEERERAERMAAKRAAMEAAAQAEAANSATPETPNG